MLMEPSESPVEKAAPSPSALASLIMRMPPLLPLVVLLLLALPLLLLPLLAAKEGFAPPLSSFFLCTGSAMGEPPSLE